MRSLPLLKPKFWTRSAAMLAAIVGLSLGANAQTVTTLIDDSFGDGQGSNTGTVAETAEASFFTTSSSDGISTDPDFAVPGGGFRFISGTSGRAIHTQFTPTTLATAGDRIDVSFDFTTPATVQETVNGDGVPNDEEFRFGLFDTSNASGVNTFTGRNQTATPISLGTDTGNPIDFGANISSGSNNNQPGLELNGFTSEIDIERDNPNGDISFRVSDLTGDSDTATSGVTGNGAPSGRLTTTTGGFDGLGSGPGFGFDDLNGDGVADPGESIFTVDPNTLYTATLTIELLESGDFEVTSSIDGGDLVGADNLTTDIIFGTTAAAMAAGSDQGGLETGTFDLLTFSASSDAFGVSNVADNDADGVLDADNGITFNNLTVTSTLADTAAIPEPSSLALLGLMGCAGLIRRRR